MKFPAVEQEVTVLFADVRGFTSLAERAALGPLRRSLNTLFGAASDLLVRNDALVDKFLGDAVMALFNAPIPHPHHQATALATALALQELMPRLDLPFAIGIGLNSGRAITGNVGGGDVTDYTAIGDTVNVAARLSGLANEGEVLAAAVTCRGSLAGLPPAYAAELVTLQVKGRAEPVEAFRIYPVRPEPPRPA